MSHVGHDIPMPTIATGPHPVTLGQPMPAPIAPGVSIAELRRAAARDFTQIVERHTDFSFVRLGDGEAWYLINMQDGKPPPKYRYSDKVNSVELARSVSGMESRHYARFVESLEQSTFLDYCESNPNVTKVLPQLRFNRNPALYRNATPEVSNILFEWTWYELGDYVSRHRCMIASAEAALLRELRSDARYRELAKAHWPVEAETWFHQVREDGRHYSENLDLIKDDLKRDIEKHKIDTLMLSLATGAKILCYEVAKEMGVRVLDFGSMTRALTYAGTPGYQIARNQHNPFMFRVPLEVFMPAVERAHPDLGLPGWVAKAHGQLLLNLQKMQPFAFNPSDACRGGAVDMSSQNLANFKQDLRYYNQTYLPRIKGDPEATRLHRDFVYWCMKKGLGVRGKIFVALVKIKGALRNAMLRLTGRAAENHDQPQHGNSGTSA